MSALTPDRLATALARGLAPLTWIHGDEPLIQIECADQVRAAARAAGFSERVVIEVDRTFSNEKWLAEAASLSLFGERKLIELRCPAKPRRDLADAAAQWLADPPEDVRLLVSSQRPDTAVLRGPAFRRLEADGMVVAVYPVPYGELPGWIAARLRAQGQRASRELLELIAARVDGNLLAANQEIRKLGLLFAQGELDTRAAGAAVLDVARFDGGDLVEAALAGDLARMRRCLAGLREASSADVMVIWHLADVSRQLLRLALARGTGTAAPPIRGPLARVRLIEKAARRIDAERAGLALAECARADTIAKGFQHGVSWELIERICLRLAGHEPLPLPADPLAL